MTGILYVVATPIGNLEDITVRALRLLREEVDIIFCENTYTTRKLLVHYQISKPTLALYGDIPHQMKEALRYLEEGRSVALISEAGTPGLCDPGSPLVAAALERLFPVVPVPGPSAVVTALSLCGFPCERFLFEGFFPKRPGQQQKTMERIKALPDYPVVFFASPHRIQKIIETLAHALGENQMIFLGRELTKKFEELRRESLGSLRRALLRVSWSGESAVERTEREEPSSSPVSPLRDKGEFVLILPPRKAGKQFMVYSS